MQCQLKPKKCCASLEINDLPRPCLAGDLTKIVPRTVQSKSSSITKIDEKFISAPLPNSFIHAAHGSANATESWGSPESISQQILANPQLPENPQKPADFGPRRNGPLRASRKAPQPPKKPVLCCEEQSFAEMHAQVCCQK